MVVLGVSIVVVEEVSQADKVCQDPARERRGQMRYLWRDVRPRMLPLPLLLHSLVLFVLMQEQESNPRGDYHHHPTLHCHGRPCRSCAPLWTVRGGGCGCCFAIGACLLCISV